jgi:hypothetical protein
VIAVRCAEDGTTCGSCLESARPEAKAILRVEAAGVSAELCAVCTKQLLNGLAFMHISTTGEPIKRTLGLTSTPGPRRKR